MGRSNHHKSPCYPTLKEGREVSRDELGRSPAFRPHSVSGGFAGVTSRHFGILHLSLVH